LPLSTGPIYHARPFDFAFHKESGVDIKDPCLRAPACGDASHYDIKKFSGHIFSPCFPAGYGSIHPAFAKLTAHAQVMAAGISGQGEAQHKRSHRVPSERAACMRAPAQIPPQYNIANSEFHPASHAARFDHESGRYVVHNS
jgi:hypothetical protein